MRWNVFNLRKSERKKLTWSQIGTRLLVIGLLWLTANSVALFFASRISSEMETESWARHAGRLQANKWFKDGQYRLLELSPDERLHFTGRMEGPFEIWNWTKYEKAAWWQCEPKDGQFVEAFNKRMKELKKGSSGN